MYVHISLNKKLHPSICFFFTFFMQAGDTKIRITCLKINEPTYGQWQTGHISLPAPPPPLWGHSSRTTEFLKLRLGGVHLISWGGGGYAFRVATNYFFPAKL